MLEDFHLHHLRGELQGRFQGVRLASAREPSPGQLLLVSEGASGGLRFSLDAAFPAVFPEDHPSRGTPWSAAPVHPWSELVAGCEFQAVQKSRDDRALEFEIAGSDRAKALVFRVKAVSPELYLTGDGGVVIGSMGPCRTRLAPTGEPLPGSGRGGRIAPEARLIRDLLEESGVADPAKLLPRKVELASPLLVAEALARAGGGAPDSDALSLALEGVIAEAYAQPRGFLLYADGGWMAGGFAIHPTSGVRLSTFPLLSTAGWTCVYQTSLSSTVVDWWRYARSYAAFDARRRKMADALATSLGRCVGRIDAFNRDLEEARDGESHRKMGELVLVHLHRFGAGARMDRIRVPDIYEPGEPEVDIFLEPDRSLKENADLFFRRHRKARAALALIPELILAEEARRVELSRFTEAVRSALTPEDLEKGGSGLLKERSATATVRVKEKGGKKDYSFKKYETRRGLVVMAGRSAEENDRLTFRAAKPDDFWFHAADYKGSHVVLVWGKKKDPPLEDLVDAAGVAARMSGASRSPWAEVHCTRRKFVRKVKGAPGKVVLERSRTLRVRPGLPQKPGQGDPGPGS